MASILIDSPVNPFSPKEKIQEWIDYLKTMPESPEVIDAIVTAKSYLLPNEPTD